MEEMNEGLNLVLLGKTGAGKSSTGNTILGRQAFISKKCPESVTKVASKQSNTVCGYSITVYDTPGYYDTGQTESEIQLKYQNIFQECESGPCVFLLVIKADRFTEEERKTVEKIEKLLGQNRLEKTWILFTGGDQLEDENMTIQEFVSETETLKKLIQKYNQRYHVFNNKTKEHTKQVKMLIAKFLTCVKTMVKGTNRLNPLKRKLPKKVEQNSHGSSLSSRRIVLLGKTGVGKSAAGNTILGQKEFRSDMSMNAVTSKCSVKHATVSGRSMSVVDTPGFFDTKMDHEQIMTEIAKSVYISSPGPHAFLIVFPVNMRFTEQEVEIPQMIELMFGHEVLKYSIILFTHGDQLKRKSIKKLIEKSHALRHLVDECGGRFHVFNNKKRGNREQVNDLLQKIDTMIEQNGGGHYSNQMFDDAQRFRQEEEENRQKEVEEKQREEEEIKHREEQERKHREEEERKQEEKQMLEDIERVRKETEEKTRAKCEAQFKSKLESLEAQIQRENNVSKQQEKQQRQDEIDSVETDETHSADCVAQLSAEQESLLSPIQCENNVSIQQEKQRQDEIDSVETNEINGAESEDQPKAKQETSSGFKKFFSRYRKLFYILAGVVIGAGAVACVAGIAVFGGLVAGGAAIGGTVAGGAAIGGTVAAGLVSGVVADDAVVSGVVADDAVVSGVVADDAVVSGVVAGGSVC